jgi:hypothetical protein
MCFDNPNSFHWLPGINGFWTACLKREERREKIMCYNPPPLDQWASDTLDNAVQKPPYVVYFLKTRDQVKTCRAEPKNKRPADFCYRSKLHKRMILIHSDYGLVHNGWVSSIQIPSCLFFVFVHQRQRSLSLSLSSLSSLCGFVSVAVQLWLFPGLCCSPTWQSKTPWL